MFLAMIDRKLLSSVLQALYSLYFFSVKGDEGDIISILLLLLLYIW